MPSKIWMICNSYESGYGHGLANDGLDLSKTPHADPEQGEAYQIGYEEGQEAYQRKVGAGDTATLHQQIRSAQIAAGEDAVLASLRRMGLA